MRTTLSVLSLCVLLLGCDFPKSVGDDDTTTGDGMETTSGTFGSSSVSGAPTAGTTGAFPGTASATVTSGGGVTTAAGECPGFDPGPANDPDSEYMWECFCSTCVLTYEDIPYESVEAFDETGLCDCLCAANGCGSVEGEGGVTGGSFGTDDTGSPTTSATATTGWGESSGVTTEAAPLTYAACIDQGGVIVGDMGDGAVFEPDYVCPSGDSPIGVLDFEPGMPFPKNGGVCCPPGA